MALKAHVRFWRSGLAAVALAGSGVASLPAQADNMFGLFSPDVGQPTVAASVMRQGYVVRSAIVRRGDVYVFDASGSARIDGAAGHRRSHRTCRPALCRTRRGLCAGPQRYAPAVGGGGLFGPPPRPLVDVPQTRPQAVEAYPDFDAPPAHHRELAYGGGTRAASDPEPKPVERPKVRTVRPKPVWTAAPAAKPSDAAAAPAATDPVTTGATAPSEPVKPAAALAAPSEPAKPAAALAAPSEPAKPVAAAPAKSEGVVASSAPPESAPAAAPPPPPRPRPPRAKPKAINDIPVTPLD